MAKFNPIKQARDYFSSLTQGRTQTGLISPVSRNQLTQPQRGFFPQVGQALTPFSQRVGQAVGQTVSNIGTGGLQLAGLGLNTAANRIQPGTTASKVIAPLAQRTNQLALQRRQQAGLENTGFRTFTQAVKPAVQTIGIAKSLTPAGMIGLGIAGGLGAAFDRRQGETRAQAFGRSAADIGLTTNALMPATDFLAQSVTGGKNLLTRQLTTRGATGALNVLENEVIDRLNQINPTWGSRAASFGVGALLSPTSNREFLKVLRKDASPSERKAIGEIIKDAQGRYRDLRSGKFAKQLTQEIKRREPMINTMDYDPSGKRISMPLSQYVSDAQNLPIGMQARPKGGTKAIFEAENKAFNINLNRMNLDAESKVNLKQSVADINSELVETKGRKFTDKEALNLARVTESYKRIIPREKTAQFAASLTRLRQEVAVGAKGGGLSTDFINNIKVLSSVAADSGRRLQKFSIGVDPETRSIKEEIVQELVKLGHSADEMLEAAKGYDLNNPKEATEFYRKFVKPTFGEKLSEYRYINLLSSPKTHIVNAFSNLLQAGVVSPATKLYSGTVDTIASRLTGKKQQHYVSQVPAYYKGLLNSMGDSFREAGEVFRGEKMVQRPDVDRLPTGSRVLQPLQGITRALEASDVFFRGIIKAGEKESILNRLNKQGKKFSESTIDKMAGDKASYFVFREALDPSNKSGQGKLLANIDKLTESIYTLRRVPGVSWFIPFVQTPMNILKQGIEYSPAGLATLPGAADKTEQVSKALLGSTVLAGAAWVANAGDSTWAAPISEKDKEAFYASGRQPYSIKIGDSWVSYSKLGPLAYPIAMASAMKYYSEQDPKSPSRSKLEQASKALGGMAKFFSDQSYMQGLGDLVKTIQGDTTAAKQFISNVPSQLVPLSALTGLVARTIDPIYRKPSNPIESLKTGIPFMSQSVPAYTNPAGEPSRRQNRFFNSLSPINVTPNQQGYDNLYQNRIQYKKFEAVDKKVRDLIKAGEQEKAVSLIKANASLYRQGGILKSDDKKVTDLQKMGQKAMGDPRLSDEQKQKFAAFISKQIQSVSGVTRQLTN